MFPRYFKDLLTQQCYVDLEKPRHNTLLLKKHILTTESAPEATLLGLAECSLAQRNARCWWLAPLAALRSPAAVVQTPAFILDLAIMFVFSILEDIPLLHSTTYLTAHTRSVPFSVWRAPQYLWEDTKRVRKHEWEKHEVEAPNSNRWIWNLLLPQPR